MLISTTYSHTMWHRMWMVRVQRASEHILGSIAQTVPNSNTVYVVIFAVVSFSQISRVRPRKNIHFNLCPFIVMKISENCEIKPSQISKPSPKQWKYLYAKIMAYTVWPSKLHRNVRTHKIRQNSSCAHDRVVAYRGCLKNCTICKICAEINTFACTVQLACEASRFMHSLSGYFLELISWQTS